MIKRNEIQINIQKTRNLSYYSFGLYLIRKFSFKKIIIGYSYSKKKRIGSEY